MNIKTKNRYGDEQLIPLLTDFTCPSDGIIRVGGYGGKSVDVIINSVSIMQFNCDITFGNENSYHSWRVNKNDIVYIHCASSDIENINTRVFVPVS